MKKSRNYQDFGQAVKRAVQAGFSGWKSHGANHYLRILASIFVRTDGAELWKNVAFPLAVVSERAAAKYAPEDFYY